MTFVPLNPIPLKDRTSMIFLQYGQIDVLDGAFVLIDKTGIRTHIPVGSVACIMLEPGTRVSHAAVRLASTVGTLLVWVGEAGVRVYSSGQPGGARADKLLYQAKLALDDDLRLKVVRKMYELRFREPPPARRSVEQLRGIEGSRVRATYALLAKQCGEAIIFALIGDATNSSSNQQWRDLRGNLGILHCAEKNDLKMIFLHWILHLNDFRLNRFKSTFNHCPNS